jgi:hypothetical protein
VNDTDPPRPDEPCPPVLPAQAAHRLDRQADSLREEVLADPLLRHGREDPACDTTADEDLDVWLGALTGRLGAPDVRVRFRERAVALRTAGLPCEEALIRQHVCAGALMRALSETGEREVVGRLVLHTLGVATTAIVGRYRNEDASEEAACSRAPQPPGAAPRWCLAATRVGRDGSEALRRFRAANPQALIAVTGAHLTAFTTERPREADVFGPHGLVYAGDGQTVRAARRAALAAVVARHYGVSVDTERALPLIAALDMPAEQREAFVTSCLGPLHTSARHRHLLETLSVYLAHNLCVSAAARALYVHRHTMAYRLQAIGELTGLKLNSPFDRMRAELALVLSQAPTWTVPHARHR